MVGQVFVVTRTLASYLEEGSVVIVTQILDGGLIVEKSDTDGIISTIQVPNSLRDYLYLVYAE